MSETQTAGEQSPANVNAMSEAQQVAAIAAMIEPPTESPATDANAGDPPSEGEAEAAPETASEQESETDAEAELPPIEAPNSWSKDDRELFTTLPRETQEVIARRERERDAATQRVMNESAQVRKAAEAERAQAAQERAFFAERLAPMLQETQQRLASDFSPEALAQLANTDPAGYVARIAERDAMIARAQAAQAVMEQQRQSILAQEQQKLHEAMPDWKDPSKFADANRALRSYGEKLGYTQQELDSVVDHRALVVLEKARRYDELMTKGPTAVANKAAQPKPAPRVISSAQRSDTDGANAGLKKAELMKIARKGSADAQIAALTQLLQ